MAYGVPIYQSPHSTINLQPSSTVGFGGTAAPEGGGAGAGETAVVDVAFPVRTAALEDCFSPEANVLFFFFSFPTCKSQLVYRSLRITVPQTQVFSYLMPSPKRPETVKKTNILEKVWIQPNSG